MRYTLSEHAGGQKTYVLVFDIGDEFFGALGAFLNERNIRSGYFTGIGGCSAATVGFYNPETKVYDPVTVTGQYEMTSITGDVALFEGQPFVHAHVGLAALNGHIVAGHLLQAHVRPTIELFLTELAAPLQRTVHPAARIPLIELTS